jgi:hypothetical protein
VDICPDRRADGGDTVARQLKFPITIFFPMLDGETVEEAENRMIERIDPDGDVGVMSWNDGEVEVIEDDEDD